MQMVFVNMGLPLEQARVSFATIDPRHRGALAERLEAAVRNTALAASEMAFPSFEARFGYGFALSASDAVHALTGLMVRHAHEVPGGGKGGGGGGGGGGAGGGAAANGGGGGDGGGGGQGDPDEVAKALKERASADFWLALRALDVRRGVGLLKDGIEQAKALQRAVVQ